MESSLPNSETPVLDDALIGQLRALGIPGTSDFFGRVITQSIESADHHVAALHLAIAGGDALRSASIAHALKGNSATVGALKLAKRAGAIEKRARAGDVEGVDTLLAALDAEHARTRAALRTVLDQHLTEIGAA